MPDNTARFQHVAYRWIDDEARDLDPVERLVYRSNLLGSDQRITNTGGGNTSSKLTETDPVTGAAVEVLWVKGSGGDLRTSTRANFASLYMDRLLQLRELYESSEGKGYKSVVEDRMVAMYPHGAFGLNPRAASIDTPLHGFVPHRHVDHTHPNAVIAIAAAKDGERLTREIYGDEVGWVPWQRPGFDLGLQMQRAVEADPGLKGIVMGQHGLINWSDDDRECYQLSLDLIERAAAYLARHDKGAATFGGRRVEALERYARRTMLRAVLPGLRGLVSRERRMIATVQSDAATLEFADSVDAPRLTELGTSCPDHFLRTKIKPLFVDWDPASGDVRSLLATLELGLERYREDYAEYYRTCRRPDSPAMRDPNPTVVVIPGLGMIGFGKNKSESRVTTEFYRSAIAVMRGAEAVSEYVALPPQEAFDIEYWALEEAKLQRMPVEQEFERRVVAVVGAGSGIGRATALRFAREGAHVVCADLDEAAAGVVASEIIDQRGQGIGIAGSEVSGCGPAIAVRVDVTDRESVRALFDTAIEAYGGVDGVIVTAGIFVTPGADGKVPDAAWRSTFDVNVTGAFLVADEARHVWDEQGLRGSLVLTTSANGMVAKRGSFAYDASKAAANHLVRELAMEFAPLVRVNALAPATVVEGSSMFPRDRVIASLTKYGIAFDPAAETASLRTLLAGFYAERTLTKLPITLDDQAEAALLLASDRLAKTTGQILLVDGGLHEAFLR